MTTKPKGVVKYTPSKLRPVQKTHGGKAYLARRLISLFPNSIETYAEPFTGGGSVFLNYRPDLYKAAVLNDLYHPTYLLWLTLRNKAGFRRFHDAVRRVPCTEQSFLYHKGRPALGPVDWAVKHYCTNRMSRGGMGEAFAASGRLRGGRNETVNAWETSLEELPLVHERLSSIRCGISCTDAMDLLYGLGGDREAFIYLDPPYVPEERTSPNVYHHEMGRPAHERLVNWLRDHCEARVMISGYHCPLYDKALKDWRVVEFDMPNHSGQGDVKQRRIEVIWMNYKA